VKSYLVKPGQQKDSPIRYTAPWTETAEQQEYAELQALMNEFKDELPDA